MSDLFRSELEDLLALERQLLDEVLPDMRERAHAAGLRAALDRHLLETKTHVDNLERVLVLAEAGEIEAATSRSSRRSSAPRRSRRRRTASSPTPRRRSASTRSTCACCG